MLSRRFQRPHSAPVPVVRVSPRVDICCRVGSRDAGSRCALCASESRSGNLFEYARQVTCCVTPRQLSRGVKEDLPTINSRFAGAAEFVYARRRFRRLKAKCPAPGQGGSGVVDRVVVLHGTFSSVFCAGKKFFTRARRRREGAGGGPEHRAKFRPRSTISTVESVILTLLICAV